MATPLPDSPSRYAANSGRTSWLKRFLTKKMTLVLIPHSERRSSQFEVSYLTLSIVATLLIFSICVAIIVPRMWSLTQQETEQQYAENVRQTEKLTQLSDNIHELNDAVSALGAVSWAVEGTEELPAYLENQPMGEGGELTEDPERFDTDAANTISGNEVEVLRESIRDIMEYTEVFRSHNEFRIALTELMKNMPSIHPLLGRGFMLSPFGYRVDPIDRSYRMHNGVDIGEMPGTPIRATGNGRVKLARASGGAGLYVIIEHSFGFSSHYMHLQAIRTKEGARVKRGEIIGLLGSTGRSTGPHLHYEVRINDTPVDPAPYIQMDRTRPVYGD